MRTPFILVDHGSYELQNLGDAAMLIATVERLAAIMPDAQFGVITVDREALWRVLPQAVAVVLPPIPRWVPARVRDRVRVKWKRASKVVGVATSPVYRVVSSPQIRHKRGSSRTLSLGSAIRESDIVVAAGGGYVNDIFAGHGGGVLRLLERAQRDGRTTAMFGQGLGPFDKSKALYSLACRVMSGLDVLTLREGTQGPEMLRSMGVSPSRHSVTGDDAIYLAMGEVRRRLNMGLTSQSATGIGLNVRKANYSGIDASNYNTLHQFTTTLDEAVEGTFVAMPIASGAPHDDLGQILRCLPDSPRSRPVLQPPQTSWDLVTRAAQCRVMVTASYHAAVFALAVGVPVVALTNSQYYDWKFGGLRDLYGSDMVRLVPLSGESLGQVLVEETRRAWELGGSPRRAALELTYQLQELQQQRYEQVAARVRG